MAYTPKWQIIERWINDFLMPSLSDTWSLPYQEVIVKIMVGCNCSKSEAEKAISRMVDLGRIKRNDVLTIVK